VNLPGALSACMWVAECNPLARLAVSGYAPVLLGGSWVLNFFFFFFTKKNRLVPSSENNLEFVSVPIPVPYNS